MQECATVRINKASEGCGGCCFKVIPGDVTFAVLAVGSGTRAIAPHHPMHQSGVWRGDNRQVDSGVTYLMSSNGLTAPVRSRKDGLQSLEWPRIRAGIRQILGGDSRFGQLFLQLAALAA